MKTGDRVVCIKSHDQGVVKKGQEFIIKDVWEQPCGHIAFDVGIIGTYNHTRCSVCNSRHIKELHIWWLNSIRFAPIITKSEFISSEEFTTIEETIDVPIKEPAL